MKANYFLAGVMALSLLASCVKEDVGGVGGPGKEGLETEATVTIKIYGQDGTRAVSTRAEGTDGNTDGTDTGNTGPTTTEGIGAENTLQSIDILQFMGQNDAATLESVTSVDLTKLPAEATQVTQTIRGSEGSKTFVAIANDTTKLIKSKLVTKGDADKDDQGATAATTLGAFKKLLFTAAEEVTDPTFSRNLRIINKDAGNAIESFMMVSDLDTVTLVSTVSSLSNANVNQVSLALTRLTAKVQMTWKGTIDETKFHPTNIDGNALEKGEITFETGKFQIMNVKPDMYPTAVETFPSAAYGKTVLGWNDALLPDTYWIDAAAAFNGEFATSGYTTENLMFRETPQKRDATCLLVHTKLNIAGGTPTGLPDENENPDKITLGDGTFWAIAKFPKDSLQVYRNLESFEGIYTNYKTAKTKLETLKETGNYSLVEFKGGTVYYRVDLLDWVKGAGKTLQEVASVQRNRFYQVSIGNILALGWPNPEEVIDPDDSRPIEDPELNIEATIKIADWVNVSQDVDLQ